MGGKRLKKALKRTGGKMGGAAFKTGRWFGAGKTGCWVIETFNEERKYGGGARRERFKKKKKRTDTLRS